jgi:hypothetical protein
MGMAARILTNRRFFDVTRIYGCNDADHRVGVNPPSRAHATRVRVFFFSTIYQKLL